MATISSVGIGSGLDVNNIVSQLVALEKQPLKTLELKATNVQSQISAFAEIQSQFAALTDVAKRIATPTAWAARNASSSNTSAATITATGSANATSFSLDVDQLATKQSISSATLAPGALPGAGTLTLQLGSWDSAGTTFTAGSASAATITVGATDTIATIAASINSADAGVVATVFNDGTNERLLLQSKATGAASGFRVQSDDAALQGFVFDPQNKAGVGMAAAGLPQQLAQDAAARINGLAVTSSSNTLTDNVPGVTISLLATTTTGYGTVGEVKSPLTMTISEDVTPAVKNVNDFVTAYNTLNKNLADLTKYDAATKQAGLFQGDSSVVGLQRVLRSMATSMSTGGAYQRLSDVGIELQLDGSLNLNVSKLSVAANNGTELQKLFTTDSSNVLTNGFALKFKTLGEGVAASGGSLVSKAAALKSDLSRNAAAQTKINDYAAAFETRLRARYSALDAQMGRLNALNAYVTQQVTLWNKNTA
ncbi:MAG: flagellar cap protein FliD [Comamonadaceae bacterium CG12_big_fil_rev_8_21_14_0_65_59_15]|nr:MAG: flagellar cap protein FliD [Comamonadaceae bacterium CG12_big_fil_rev_8_21_14_0_65_59_15]